MHIECLFSPGPRQILSVQLDLPEGAKVADALALFKSSPELQMHAQALMEAIDHAQCHGLWARKVPLSHLLKEGDRLEIYRPLVVDPKLARKQRFKRQGKGRTGLFARRRVGAVAGY